MNYKNGHDFEYRWLRPSLIKADPLYQRPVDVKRVEKIAANFNGDIFNEPKVSYRDGVYWVFDGQHSIVAWRKVFNGVDKPVYCKVFKGMTWLDECDAFITQNGFAKDPSVNEKLRAAYNSGDPGVRDMVEKANLCGYVVDFAVSKTPTRIVATSALMKAYTTLGPAAYFDLLTTIKMAWYGDMDAICSQIITGLTTFFKVYGGNFRVEELAKALAKVAPAKIVRDGKQYRGRSNTYSKEIVKAYNFKKTKYRLDESKL